VGAEAAGEHLAVVGQQLLRVAVAGQRLGEDPAPEPDLGLVVHGLVQGGLQVAAQQGEVRLAEHRGDGGLGDGELAASSGVDVDELPQVDVLLLERREDAEALGGLVAGGRDVDEVAVAAAGERLFDDQRLPADLAEPEGGGQAGDAGTGDEHTWPVMGGHVTAAFAFG
jgi:hypothetical protein